MSLFDRLLGRRAETRSAVSTATLDMLAAGGAAYVSADRAAGLSVVHRCVAARAEALASLPLRVFERDAAGARREVVDHPLRGVLGDFALREELSIDCDMHGNAYAELVVDARGEVTGLRRLPARAVSVERLSDGRLRYRATLPDGATRVLSDQDVLHVRHASRDGVLGLSPLAAARETVALALEQQTQAIGMAKNGARPSGAIVIPGVAKLDQIQNLREVFNREYAGASAAGKIMVLDGAAEWKPFAMTAKDAEFVESRKLSDLALARLFAVPPSVAGIPFDSNYSTAAEEARSFVAHCLAPWARRFEAAFNAALFTAAQRRRFFVEHDLSGLLRGDPEARFAAYRIGREAGVYSANDIRRFENLPPVEGGDTYLEPLNMQRMGGGGDGA